MTDPCPYCDGVMLRANRDHIVPKRMGNRGMQNLIRCCMACNTLKGDMTPAAMRVQAKEVQDHALLLLQIADRTEALIRERGLMSAPKGEVE